MEDKDWRRVTRVVLEGSFGKAAPVLWNTLLSTIKAAASLPCCKKNRTKDVYILKQRFYSHIHENNACQLLTFIYLFIYLNVFYATFILHFMN